MSVSVHGILSTISFIFCMKSISTIEKKVFIHEVGCMVSIWWNVLFWASICFNLAHVFRLMFQAQVIRQFVVFNRFVCHILNRHSIAKHICIQNGNFHCFESFHYSFWHWSIQGGFPDRESRSKMVEQIFGGRIKNWNFRTFHLDRVNLPDFFRANSAGQFTGLFLRNTSKIWAKSGFIEKN